MHLKRSLQGSDLLSTCDKINILRKRIESRKTSLTCKMNHKLDDVQAGVSAYLRRPEVDVCELH